MRSVNFEYGSFNYDYYECTPDRNDKIHLIIGSFAFPSMSCPRYFWGEFILYNLYEWNTNPQERVSLGPYLPWHICKDSNISFPKFSALILNSKSSRVSETNSSEIELRLKVLTNLYSHYLLNANINLGCDLILPVPAKPKYSINCLEYSCTEFSNILRIPTFPFILKRLSDEEKIFELNAKFSTIIKDKKILLVDDIITSGDTENRLRRVLMQGGALSVKFLTFGKTDSRNYQKADSP
ncbi:MAG: hypothetical protein RBG13Loki_0650 [Promethearchaeota archaeon CR_4]|nr:MAG: hypothetical protein RBG13Loki_0650 [Candidatus Lokiarchaeota archaeon CR_4]